jgi:peptidyl-prolyl cis-trans isomerase D
MLDLFRRGKKRLKWTLWVVIFALSGGMVLLFVDVPTGGGLQLGTRDIAVVADTTISAREFRRSYQQAYEFFRRNYGGNQDPRILKQMGLHTQVLNQLISQHAALYEAQRLGIGVTTEEIAQRIANRPDFQKNGAFIGAERYRQILTANNLSATEFEYSVRLGLGTEKLSRVLTDGIFPTQDEVRQRFEEQDQEIRLRYVLIDPNKLVPTKVKDEELQTYYSQNKQNYELPEQRKIQYMQVSFKPQEITLTEEQIQTRMASISEVQEVRASHVLIATTENPESEAKARKEAEELLSELRAGADFVEIATKHSDDKASGAKGGDLGFFERGRMVPEFEEVAFSLDPGQISDLVRSQFGFHIIKVTDSRKADRKALAESQLRQEEGRHFALNLATKMLYQAKNGASLEVLAQQNELEVGESSFFGLGDVIPALTVRSDFNQQVFTLSKGEVIESPYDTGDGFLVAKLTDTKDPEDAEFELVKERVLKDFKSSRGEELARERAFSLSKAAQEGSGLRKAAGRARIKVTTTDLFKRNTSIDDKLGLAREIHERAFRMEEGKVGPPVSVSNNYVVFEIAEKTQIDESKFEQEKDTLRAQLTQQKRGEFFAAWIQKVVQNLQEENRIEINNELVDSIVG